MNNNNYWWLSNCLLTRNSQSACFNTCVHIWCSRHLDNRRVVSSEISVIIRSWHPLLFFIALGHVASHRFGIRQRSGHSSRWLELLGVWRQEWFDAVIRVHLKVGLREGGALADPRKECSLHREKLCINSHVINMIIFFILL